MIQIRGATLADMPELLVLLKQFQTQAPIHSLRSGIPDDFRLQNITGELMRSGLVLVAVTGDQLVGMLMAARVQDLWIPEIQQLREVAWYVSPEWRGSSAGYRLLSEYRKIGATLVANGQISDTVLTTMVNSPELKLNRRGWQQIETNYVMEI